jgi:DNA-binding transcriptional regulator of glucitol operon
VRPLLTPGWLVKHALGLVLTLACAALAWWQVTRAADGNLLSYGYALLWPVFGAFVVVIWVREARLAVRGITEEAEPEPAPGYRAPLITRRPAERTSAAAADDPALTAYNEYLARIAERDRAEAEGTR